MPRILGVLERLPVAGTLVTINAIATDPTVAAAIIDLKRSQPTLHDDVVTEFEKSATAGLLQVETINKNHGCIETRTKTFGHDVAWMTGDRRHTGERRFPGLACLINAVTQVEHAGTTTRDIRYFIAWAALSPEDAAEAVRSHWGIESLH